MYVYLCVYVLCVQYVCVYACILCLCVYDVFIFVCAQTCVYHVYGGQRFMLNAFSYHSALVFEMGSFTLNLELTNWSRLAGQQALGIFFSPCISIGYTNKSCHVWVL